MHQVHRSLLTMSVTALAMVLFAGCGVRADSEASDEAASSAVDTSAQAEAVAVVEDASAAAPAIGSQWQYAESSDKMGRGDSKTATVSSDNEITFGSPYDGPQRARLMFRKHPEYGKNAILTIERGQFLCGIEDCFVTVRFDEDAPKKYRVREAADNSTTTLFIDGFDGFLKRAKSAKRVLIEAQFYQEGARVMEFNVEGLNW